MMVGVVGVAIVALASAMTGSDSDAATAGSTSVPPVRTSIAAEPTTVADTSTTVRSHHVDIVDQYDELDDLHLHQHVDDRG